MVSVTLLYVFYSDFESCWMSSYDSFLDLVISSSLFFEFSLRVLIRGRF